MTSRKLDEVATDIDDASTTADELQAKPNQDTDTTDKLDELHDALEHASDTLDDIENSDEIDAYTRAVSSGTGPVLAEVLPIRCAGLR